MQDRTHRDVDAPAPHAASGAHLFLSLECARPLAGPARFALDDTDEITFGRGAARAFVREGRDGRRCLAIRVPDPRMSGSHARLVRLGQGFLFEDLGSTNGSLLDGRPVQRAPVTDGARLELGSTIFILRLGMATPPGTAPDVDGASAIGGVAGLATVIPALGEALGKLARVAASTVPVLLLGETGSGKEVLARAVHALSGRGGPFVPVNCGALPEALVEGQLFGHLRGAFSGAVRDEPGLVRASHGGTLFLDEIGDLPRASQAALLRVLQEREVTPVGATRAIPVDLRVIAATHRRVDAAGGFRNDLYARLAGFTHHLDPLRDRREDLGVLVASLLAAASPERADRIRLSPPRGARSSPTPGRSTCASSRRPSRSRWCSPRAG
ncbi:MAG: sigma 54-interacting transcriptional regulator [Byssovorax sp.]